MKKTFPMTCIPPTLSPNYYRQLKINVQICFCHQYFKAFPDWANSKLSTSFHAFKSPSLNSPQWLPVGVPKWAPRNVPLIVGTSMWIKLPIYFR